MGRIRSDKEETRGRGLPGKVCAQSCLGTNGEDGGRGRGLGGLRAPAAEWKRERWNRDSAPKQKGGRGGLGSGEAGRLERSNSGSQEKAPGAWSGRCGARQVWGRSHVRAGPGGEEPRGGGADAGPAGGVRRSSSARAAGAAELELDSEPGPGRESGPGPGRSGLQRYGVGRL